METPHYMIISIGFILLTLFFYGLVLRELKTVLPKTNFSQTQQKKIFNRLLTALIFWFGITTGLSLSGFLSNFSSIPPRIMGVLVVPLVAILWITFSKASTEIVKHVPPQNLVRLQSFRIFVEILLWMLFLQNLLPVQMSFEGRNFDILAGLSAPVAAFLISRNKISGKGIIVWNILSLALLFNIVTIAILSLPGPLRYFMNEPANTIVTHFPIIFLPAFLVPLAYGLHFLSIKQTIHSLKGK
jgi:hypothetical protein